MVQDAQIQHNWVGAYGADDLEQKSVGDEFSDGRCHESSFGLVEGDNRCDVERDREEDLSFFGSPSEQRA
jgi:hypothetical protein